MHRSHIRRLWPAVLVLLLSACAIDLGTHDGAATTSSRAFGIGDDGTVVGRSGVDAFVLRPGGEMELLARPSADALPPGIDPASLTYTATGIGPDGTVIGYAHLAVDSPLGHEAVIWSPHGMARFTDTESGNHNDDLVDINAHGEVLGNRYEILDFSHGVVSSRPFILAADGTRTYLAGEGVHVANGFNDEGVIVGRYAARLMPARAVRWERADAQPTDLFEGTDARDVNNAGDVVGTAGPRAVLWATDGIRYDVPNPDGVTTRGVDVGPDGLVVGLLQRDDRTRPFAWRSGESLRELGTLGGSRTEVTAVNEAGAAVGWGERPAEPGATPVVHAIRFQ
jgi:uncharacterized membrane protein